MMRVDLLIHVLFAFAMPKKKFYAVSKGRRVGIFHSWDECKKQVDGFKNAEFKGFSTLPEAQKFCGLFSNAKNKNDAEPLPRVPKKSKRALEPPAEAVAPAKRPRVKNEERLGGAVSNLSVLVSFDGGSRGNPGVAGSGAEVIVVGKNSKGRQTERRKIQIRRYLGSGNTNNVAEWTGALVGLEHVVKYVDEFLKRNKGIAPPRVDLVIQGDSQLVIRQLDGTYQCRNVALKRLQRDFRTVVDKMKRKIPSLNISYQHVYRDDNAVADRLANEAMDTKKSWISSEGDLPCDFGSTTTSSGDDIQYADV